MPVTAEPREASIARQEAEQFSTAVFPPKTPAWAKKPMHEVPLSPETRKLLRDKAKTAEREAKLRELEGPLVTLPALVLRDGTVAPVPLEHVTSVLTPCLTALSLDCETTGYQLGHRNYALRTVQLGGEHLAVVLDAEDPVQLGLVSWTLRAAQRLHAHSAVADLVPCVAAGLISWDEAWGKMHDSVLYAKLTDPAMSESDADGLKELEHDLLKDQAVAQLADQARSALFRHMKTLTDTEVTTPPERSGWAQVNKFCATMIRYAGSDVLALGAVMRVLEPQLPVSREVLDRERKFQEACARISLDGFHLDSRHVKAKITEYEASRTAAQRNVRVLSGGLIENPSSPDTGKKLLEIDPGIALERSEKTGEPSAAKASLEPIAKRPDLTGALCKQILEYRHTVTTLGLLLRPLEALCDYGDSRMRPTVYTIEASTGRTSCRRPNGQQLCYTSDMDILTRQGWKAFSEIDDSDYVAQWSDGIIEFVKPEAVLHQAYDGPMIRISGEHHEQVVTPAHRVYSKTRDGKLMIERADSWLKHGAVNKIVDRKFIRGGRLIGRKLTDDERLSLYRAVAVQADGHFRDDCNFVSIKVTKDRKIKRSRELGFAGRYTGIFTGPDRREVYDAKAYEADCKPWLVMPEKVFNVPALLELDSSELEGFLHEVMIWDGDSIRKAGYRQHEERAEAVDAVEMAAFLSGNSTCRSVYELKGRRYANVQVFPKTDRHASRTNVEEVPSDGMIHCVTVPSGAVVVRSASGKVIVSGNSRRGGIRACVDADPGFMGISADFSACEIRVAAALSGDKGLLEAETSRKCHQCGEFAYEEKPCPCGVDEDGKLKAHTGLHWLAAHLTFGDNPTKENRYKCKAVIFRKLFGGRPDSDVAEKIAAVFDNEIAPVYSSWDKWLRKCYYEGMLVYRNYEEGVNYAVPIEGSRRIIYRTYSGRNIYIHNGAHAAGNGGIQGTARELLVDGVLKWKQTEWGTYPILPVHDEILAWVPENRAEEAVAELGRCMETSVLSVPDWEVKIGADVDKPFRSWPDSS